MDELIRIGIDTSKSVFVLHGVDAAETPVLRKRLRRGQVLEFFARLEPTQIGLEACGAAHYWARELIALGHEVVLIPPQLCETLCQAGQERRSRRRGDLRGDEPAADALRAGEDGRPAGRTDAYGRARCAGPPPHAVHQFDPRPCRRVWAGLRQRARQDRTFAGAHRSGRDLPLLARELFAMFGKDYAELERSLRD